ncbi:MAG: helical backbone metal receptor [Bacteroides sp.]|nr:helical backbone metal receptor [Ruminococcus flavefaciens]MCM1555342.1 helical backbone metal receptor [Bacteroides sp.]
MKNLLRTGILFLLCLMATSAGFAQKAPRIVSLSPSITATLQQIGADNAIVGRTTYCPAPLDGRPNVTVGNVMETNIEQIIGLKPDIVFCMAFTKAETIERLRELGITVKDYRTPKNFDEICGQTVEIGHWAGIEKQALAFVLAERQKVEAIKDEFSSRPPFAQPPAVFFQIGDNPVFPVIEDTYMNQYLTFLGLDNIVKEYKGGGISREYVVAKNPEIMFISRMSGMGEEAAAYWKKFPSIRAVKNRRILMVDDTEACCPTPLYFRKTLEFLADYLRKL